MSSSQRRLTLLLFFLALLAAFAFSRVARGEPDEQLKEGAATRLSELGREQYAKYCSACHGPSGRGDGTIAEALTPHPADLAKIAARRRGTFPTAEIKELIDGRKLVRVHGPREMPVWGDQLQENAPNSSPSEKERVVANRIGLIIAYLRSIQMGEAK
jgi:mono/diheme cytochrome c family protein